MDTQHPGDRGWQELDKKERLVLMQNMYDSFTQAKDYFDQIVWDVELREDWKDVLVRIVHDGNRDSSNLKNWIGKKDPINGWRSVYKTFEWLRLMQFIMHLKGVDHGA